MTNKEIKICVIGLGYVGLPLCLALSRLFQVVGFDNSKTRIEELNDSYDKTNEVTKKELLESSIFLLQMISILRIVIFTLLLSLHLLMIIIIQM